LDNFSSKLIPNLDSLNIPFKNSKKAKELDKKGTFDAREMAYFVKWSGVSSMSADGKTITDEPNERQFYLYLRDHYESEYIFPSWQAVCRERKFCYNKKISMKEMANNFAALLKREEEKREEEAA